MEKTAVVLAGGGSRGAYQIGVWKAMRELHIDYQLVAGTSVGALNGALMVQQEYDKALQVWENISSQEIVGDAIPQQDDPDDRFLRRAFARQAFAHGGWSCLPWSALSAGWWTRSGFGIRRSILRW